MNSKRHKKMILRKRKPTPHPKSEGSPERSRKDMRAPLNSQQKKILGKRVRSKLKRQQIKNKKRRLS